MQPPVVRLLIAAALAQGADAAAQGLSIEVHDLTGARRTIAEAQLVGNWRLEGKQSGAAVSVDLRNVAALGFSDKKPPAAPRGTLLLLSTGEMLGAEPVALDGEQLRCRHPQLGEIVVPLAVLAGVVLDAAVGETQRHDLVRRIQAPDRQSDRLLLKNGDAIAGVLVSLDSEKARIELDGNATNIDRDRIAAVAFNASLSDYRTGEDFFAQIRLADGSLLFVRELTSGTAGKLKLTTLFGASWTVDATEVVDVGFRNGRVVYLSGLKPIEATAEPFLDGPVPHRLDRSVTGGPLSIGGRSYAKGLGVRSYSRLSYAVGGFERFEAIAGLDAAAGPLASVRFLVELDGKTIFDSGEVLRGAPPKPIAIELAGAARLSLTVDFASRGDVQDYADWCDARLIRK